jgi:hypothetical protein
MPPPVGIRLAPDVRLPVAAIPIDYKISPVAEQARQQIVIDYYREVAQAVIQADSGVQENSVDPVAGDAAAVTVGEVAAAAALPQAVASGDVSVSGNESAGGEESATGAVPGVPAGETIEDSADGPTVVVTNRPEVEAARKRADWRFKALFGSAAYNRMTMNSLLETRLPESAAANTASETGDSATGEP